MTLPLPGTGTPDGITTTLSYNNIPTYDGNGNVMGLVDSADGKWAANYEYGPFGEVIRMSGSYAAQNPFRFSTKYQDGVTGFIYFGYRYYNPTTGRWLNRDPIAEDGGVNIYALVGNGPINNYDILGLEDEPYIEMVFDWWGGFGQGVGNYAKDTVVGLANLGGDLAIAAVVVVANDCWEENTFDQLDNVGYRFSPLTDLAGTENGGWKVAGAVAASPVLFVGEIGENLYESVEYALEGDMHASGSSFGAASTGAGLAGWGRPSSFGTVGNAFAKTRAAINSHYQSIVIRLKPNTQCCPPPRTAAKTGAPAIDVAALDFSTGANKAVFYSGPGNHARAMAFAERTGATPIDLTPGGQYLNSLKLYETMPAAQADAIWAQASRAYASCAQGKINLFVNGARPGRVFHTIEAPIIKANSNIYKQTFHY